MAKSEFGKLGYGLSREVKVLDPGAWKYGRGHSSVPNTKIR